MWVGNPPDKSQPRTVAHSVAVALGLDAAVVAQHGVRVARVVYAHLEHHSQSAQLSAPRRSKIFNAF